MKVRTEIDGTATLTTEDGRRFTLSEDGGEITVDSHDGCLLVKPVSDTAFIFDTPIDQ